MRLDGASQQRVTAECVTSIENALQRSSDPTPHCCDCDSPIQSRDSPSRSGFSVSAPLVVRRFALSATLVPVTIDAGSFSFQGEHQNPGDVPADTSILATVTTNFAILCNLEIEKFHERKRNLVVTLALPCSKLRDSNPCTACTVSRSALPQRKNETVRPPPPKKKKK